MMELGQYSRQFLAETLGTFLLVVLGDGAVAQVTLGSKLKLDGFGGLLNISFGYGLAVMVGILASGGVSGGHLNPAVTVAMASLRKIKLIQVPIYMAGQYLGAFLGAAVVFGIYADGINKVGKSEETMGIFASYPGFSQASEATLAFDQILGTSLLIIIIFAVTDNNNMAVVNGMFPLYIGLGLTTIILSFGLNAGAAINPARDFSPRIFTLMAGWGTKTFKVNGYFFWIPWLLPHIGGLLGAFIYHFVIAYHHPRSTPSSLELK